MRRISRLRTCLLAWNAGCGVDGCGGGKESTKLWKQDAGARSRRELGKDGVWKRKEKERKLEEQNGRCFWVRHRAKRGKNQRNLSAEEGVNYMAAPEV